MVITKEKRDELIDEAHYNLDYAFCTEKTKQLIQIALAALEAEPVGEVVDVCGSRVVEWERCIAEGNQVYTAPPIPVHKPVVLPHPFAYSSNGTRYYKAEQINEALREAGYPVTAKEPPC